MNSDRDSSGRFIAGNKASKGRGKGVLNRFTEALKKQAEEHPEYNIGQVMMEIATDETAPKDLRLKADSKLSDLLMSISDEEDDLQMSIEEIDAKILAMLRLIIPSDYVIIKKCELL